MTQYQNRSRVRSSSHQFAQRVIAMLFLFNTAIFAAAANTAPVLNATKFPVLDGISEDAGFAAGAVGTLVSSLVDFANPAGQVDNVTDADSPALLGIAIIAANTVNGSWYYSLNNGASWKSIGPVAANIARLLPADASTRLYFRPNTNFNGLLNNAITFRAWDQTSGSAEIMADPTINGGATAFSAATDTASIFVSAVNDAPVLDASKFPSFVNIYEGTGPPNGDVGKAVSSLVDFTSPAGRMDNVIDVDGDGLLGIAVTGANNLDGTWFYSTNLGNIWSPLGLVSETSARLLVANESNRLYFQPNPGFRGEVGISFRAWDRSSGSAGGLADTSLNGGTNAFSVAIDNADLLVSARPRLSIVRTNTTIVSWWDSNFGLVSSTDLSDTNGWAAVSEIHSTNLGQISVSIPATGSNRFFRLKRP